MHWQTSRFAIDLARPQVMGIVNATPDSFSDGGQHAGTTAALRHCDKLLREGANPPARAARPCRSMKRWHACCPWCEGP